MSVITMRRGGNLVELSLNGGSLPPDLQARLEQELRYVHLTALRGADAYDHLGNYTPTRAEIRLLYRLSETTGRFTASLGWQYRLHRICREFGHTVEVFDVDAPESHPRPDRFTVDWDRLFEKMELRVKQDEMLASFETRWHGLVDVPTAVGKTFTMAGYALAHPKARIHVVTEGIDIVNSIQRHLTKYVPNVGMVGGGKCNFGRVTVISSDSLHKVAEGFDDPRSKKSPDVVFFDEVHKAAAPTIISQLARYRNCKMYGLSANVGDRFDGADKQLEGLFGEVIFSMTYQEAEALGLVAPVRVEWVKMDFEPDSDLDKKKGTQLDKWGLWRNEERNRRFAERMNQFDSDTQVLVMVATVEHAVALKQFMPEFKLCYDQCKNYSVYVRNGLLNPDDEPLMTPARREQMRQQFEVGTLKKVIATDVWSTGVSFDALPVLGRADGRDSRIMDTQIPGRASRIYNGKPYALIVDCMDIFNDTLLRRANGRKRCYIQKGWTMIGLDTKRVGVQTARQNRS